MPIANDLQEIANQTVGDLDAVQDFYEHSNIVWLSFQDFVRAGHTIAATSSNTSTTIDQLGLVRLTTRYMGEHLAGFIFRQSVTIFESFFFAFFHRILQHNPWQFSRSQLDLETVLRAKDRDEVIAGVLLKQVNEVRYGSPRDWFKALDGAVKLGCPTPDEIDTIAEIKATRDLLEHNAGIVNELYMRKAGKKSRFGVGDRIEIDDDYHLASWKLFKKVVEDLTTAATTRLSPL